MKMTLSRLGSFWFMWNRMVTETALRFYGENLARTVLQDAIPHKSKRSIYDNITKEPTIYNENLKHLCRETLCRGRLAW